MGTYCLPCTSFPFISDLISGSVPQAGGHLSKKAACIVRTEASGLLPARRTDGGTDGRTDRVGHVRGGPLPAGEAGQREHLPAGLRSSHGFCESGSPPTPGGGGGGGAKEGRGGANGSGESLMVQNITT